METKVTSLDDVYVTWNTILSLLGCPKYTRLWRKTISSSPTKSSWKIKEADEGEYPIVKNITVRVKTTSEMVITFIGNDSKWPKVVKRTFVLNKSLHKMWISLALRSRV